VNGWDAPHLIAVALVLGAAVFALAPPADPDVWWHVRTGDWILAHHRLPSVDTWTIGGNGRDWVAHAWLSEVLLSAMHKALGLHGLILYRFLGVLTLVTCLSVQAFRRTTPWRALLVTAFAVFGTIGGWGERPQLLSFLLLVLAGHLVREAITGRSSIWWTVPLTYLWANLHGLWFLGPVLVALGALGAAEAAGSTARQRLDSARPFVVAAAACVAVAALTPNGPALLAQPLRVQGYGQFVSEWGPPSIHSVYGLAFFGTVAAFLVVLARRREPLSAYAMAQLLFALLLGLMYIRTIAPAIVLMTPLLADAMGRRSTGRKPRFPARFVVACAGALVFLGFAGGVLVLTQEPDLPPAAPVAATKALTAAVPGKPRVLNEYAVGGWLLLMAPDARPAIDGRAEIYPERYVSRYIAALGMGEHWKETVTALKPNVTLLHPETPLVNGLRDELHWRTAYEDADWVVLVPPTTMSGPLAGP
jgi:hypothetical protein